MTILAEAVLLLEVHVSDVLSKGVKAMSFQTPILSSSSVLQLPQKITAAGVQRGHLKGANYCFLIIK